MQCPACLCIEADIAVQYPLDREYFQQRQTWAYVLRCLNCQSLYQHPPLSAEEAQGFYANSYQQDYREGFIGWLNAYREQFAAKVWLARFPGQTVLDYGCGNKLFLYAIQEGGGYAIGYDYDLHGQSVFRLPCDVVRMWHVIEHLTDLDATMTNLARYTRIVGETPNAAHYTSRLFGSYWGALHFPYHTVIFSPAGLRIAAERWGLKATITTKNFMPTGWAMSVENLLKRSTRKGRSRWYPLYLVLSLPFVLVDYLRGSSAVMNFELHR